MLCSRERSGHCLRQGLRPPHRRQTSRDSDASFHTPQRLWLYLCGLQRHLGSNHARRSAEAGRGGMALKMKREVMTVYPSALAGKLKQLCISPSDAQEGTGTASRVGHARRPHSRSPASSSGRSAVRQHRRGPRRRSASRARPKKRGMLIADKRHTPLRSLSPRRSHGRRASGRAPLRTPPRRGRSPGNTKREAELAIASEAVQMDIDVPTARIPPWHVQSAPARADTY